jgi:hypothetical protein
MNFGLDIASQHIRGIKVDLLKLNNNHEPEDAMAALKTYANLLMPGRNLEKSYQRLYPLLNEKINTEKITKKNNTLETEVDEMLFEDSHAESEMASFKSEKNMLEHVVGIILGSPDFQRK